MEASPCPEERTPEIEICGSVLPSSSPRRQATPPAPSLLITPNERPQAAGLSSSNKRKRAAGLTQAPKKELKKPKTTTIYANKMNDRRKATNIAAATAAAAAAARDSAGTQDPFEKMQMFMETQFAQTNENITSISASVSALNEKCNDNSTKLERVQSTAEKNSADISGLFQVLGEKDKQRQKEIVELQSAVRKLSCPSPEATRSENDTSTPTYAGVTAASTAVRPVKRTPEKETRYWMARRGLRCWPVPGQDGREIRERLFEFFGDKLRIPYGIIEESDIESVRRVGNGGKFSKIKDEVLVTFRSANLRDNAASHARNLGNCVDEKNFPTAGIRPEIPDHLNGLHKELKIYGGILRRNHGEGLRRNIKFDDSSLSLYMDVRLPGADEWLKVDWDIVREAKFEREKNSSADTRRRLTSSTSSTEVLSTPERGTRDQGSGAGPEKAVPTSATLARFSKQRSGWGNEAR